MSNEKTNIEHLRDIINKEMFMKDEALEFLEAIEDEIKDLEDDETLQGELDTANERIIELENEVEEMELGNKIECGIGYIQWETDNVQLELIMEALEERIKTQGALSVLRKLQTPLPTS